MSTEQQFVGLEPVAGDLIIESVGTSIRFWTVYMEGDKRRIRQHARCDSEPRFGRTLFIYVSGVPCESRPELTVRKVYSKDKQDGARLVRSIFSGVASGNLHFYYSGQGPSGDRWGFEKAEVSHYTVKA